MKNTKIIFTEYEFTAHDVDGHDVITDVAGINLEMNDTIEKVEMSIKRLMEKHPLISLNGNTWELEDYAPTGRTYSKEIIYTEITPRKEEKEYPQAHMG